MFNKRNGVIFFAFDTELMVHHLLAAHRPCGRQTVLLDSRKKVQNAGGANDPSRGKGPKAVAPARTFGGERRRREISVHDTTS